MRGWDETGLRSVSMIKSYLSPKLTMRRQSTPNGIARAAAIAGVVTCINYQLAGFVRGTEY